MQLSASLQVGVKMKDCVTLQVFAAVFLAGLGRDAIKVINASVHKSLFDPIKIIVLFQGICKQNCNGHGSCVSPNQCDCDEEWSGPTCNQLRYE